MRLIVRIQFAQGQPCAVVLLDDLYRTRRVVDGDWLAPGDDVFGQHPVIQREGGRQGFRQPGWFPDEGDPPAGSSRDGLDHDRAGPPVAGRRPGGQQDRRGGSDPAIGGDELGDLLVHPQRARTQA